MKSCYQKLLENYSIPWSVIYDATKHLGIDDSQIEQNQLGRGEMGIAFRIGNKVLKITTDYAEAKYCNRIVGANLNRHARIYDVLELDYGTKDPDNFDNKISNRYSNYYRYYWAIVREYLPGLFSDRDQDYYSMWMRYCNTENKPGFNYTERDFEQFAYDYIRDARQHKLPSDELSDDLEIIAMIKEAVLSVHPFGIVALRDMKAGNMGYRSDGGLVYFDLEVMKDSSPEPKFRTIEIGK
jgi:hypothetical protein